MGSYTPRPLYPQDKSHRYRLTITLGGPQSRSGPFRKEKDPLFQPGFEHDSWESSPRSSRYIDHTIPALAGRTKHTRSLDASSSVSARCFLRLCALHDNATTGLALLVLTVTTLTTPNWRTNAFIYLTTLLVVTTAAYSV